MANGYGPLLINHGPFQPSAFSHQPLTGRRQALVSPTFRRAKRVTATGDPRAFGAAAIPCLTDIFGSRIDSWSGRTPPGICLKKAPSLPSMIFSITLAGLPEFSIWAR